jgi:hypothetical protein
VRAQTDSKTQARAAHAFVRRDSFAGSLATNLVSKGLTARPKTVTRASDALLLLIELDAAEATVVSPHAACWRRRCGTSCVAGLCGWSAHCRTLAGLALQRLARQAAKGRCCVCVSPAASRQVRSACQLLCGPLR